jgi:hypothetical protein
MRLDKHLMPWVQYPTRRQAQILKPGEYMSNHARLFDTSVAALRVLNPPAGEESGSIPVMQSRRLRSGSAIAMSIRFAPEPVPTRNTIDLDEEQTTGPLPLNLEFEFFGVHYTWFDLSLNGFITFGTDSSRDCYNCPQGSRFIPLNEDLSNFMALGCIDALPPGKRRIAYEVRGTAGRRRLVLTFTAIPGTPVLHGQGMTAQVVLYERTGMVDVHTRRWDGEGSRIDETGLRFTTTPAGAHERPLDTLHR